MKEKKIFDALTQVCEDYIEEAKTTKLKKQSVGWKKWVAIAACAVVLLGGSGALVLQNLLPFGGSTAGSGAGYAGGSIFMSYAGPVFPLTLRESDNTITATRNITYDFALPSEDSLRVWGSTVEDSYQLNNPSAKEKTVTAIYPFAGNFNELQKLMPTIRVDGQQVSPTLYAGDYSGGFRGTYGANNPNGSLNILQLNSWEGYKALLEDGSYQHNAFSPYSALSQQVTVYTFTDFEAPEEYHAATQAISFTIDPDKTTILKYGFNGGETGKKGFRRYSYFVPKHEHLRSKTKLLIVIGDDISDYSLQGYKNGACKKGNELDGVSVTVTRSEKVLSDVVSSLIDEYFKHYGDGRMVPVSQEMFLGSFSAFLYQHNLLSESVSDRYAFGMLEDMIGETGSLQRVFYLEFEIIIPASESVSVVSTMHKKPSYDFACSGSNNVGVQGYDMVSRLGSNLNFNKLTAALTSTERIEIVRQNYGFDLQQGRTKVEIDPAKEHYYLEIRPVD